MDDSIRSFNSQIPAPDGSNFQLPIDVNEPLRPQPDPDPFGFWPYGYACIFTCQDLFARSFADSDYFYELSLSEIKDTLKKGKAAIDSYSSYSGKQSFLDYMSQSPEIEAAIIKTLILSARIPQIYEMRLRVAIKEARPILLGALYSGRIKSYFFSQGKNLRPARRSFWSEPKALQMLTEQSEISNLSFSLRGVKRSVCRIVLNNEDFLNFNEEVARNMLSGKNEKLSFQNLSSRDAPQRHVYKSTSISQSINCDHTDNGLAKDNYINYSPSITFMLEMSARLGLVDGRLPHGDRVAIDTVIQEINRAWRPELGEPSATRVRHMASLIRHPADASGGNFKNAKGSVS